MNPNNRSEGILEEPMSLNRYLYVMGNPINRVDYSGEKSCSIVEYCPITGQPINMDLPKEKRRCTFQYSLDKAFAKVNTLVGNTSHQLIPSEYCAQFIAPVLVAGGMPILKNIPGSNIGLCSPDSNIAKTGCDESWRGADELVLYYLKRGVIKGNTSWMASALTSEDFKYKPFDASFDPPVQIISPQRELLQRGDVIYESSYELGRAHVSMFVGWGPQQLESSVSFPEGLSAHRTDTNHYMWIVDDLSRNPPGYHSVEDDYRFSQGIRIPSTFSIDIDYLVEATFVDK
jgi:hypothetical protein